MGSTEGRPRRRRTTEGRDAHAPVSVGEVPETGVVEVGEEVGHVRPHLDRTRLAEHRLGDTAGEHGDGEHGDAAPEAGGAPPAGTIAVGGAHLAVGWVIAGGAATLLGAALVATGLWLRLSRST